MMNFGEAINAIKNGKKVKRIGWNGKDQYIELGTNIVYQNLSGDTILPDHVSMGNKAIVFNGTHGVQVGWLASQADMLSEDWVLAD